MVISICPEALNYVRRDTPHPTLILFAAPARTVISSPTGSESLVEPAGTHEPQLPKTPRKAALSAWIGSALEYYDFFIYGTAAALVFPKIFFPTGNAAAATIASLATFGVAYAARPVGSFVLGHLGDTIGRKTVLFITLFGMGLATFLIGVLPTYEQIDFAAPILLLILRVFQGLAVSGEQSSASSTSLEHAPVHRRAFYTSFTLAGTQGGNILATAVFIPIAALPEQALLPWGWRVPFLLSAVVVVVGWWIRRTLHESPAFEEEQQHDEVPTAPLKTLFRTYTPDVVKVLFAGDPQHPHPAVVRGAAGGEQGRLSHARISVDQPDASPLGDGVEQTQQHAELGRAADQGPRVS